MRGRERRDCCAERDHGERVEITSGEQRNMVHMRLFFRIIQKSRVATPTQAIATLSCVSTTTVRIAFVWRLFQG